MRHNVAKQHVETDINSTTTMAITAATSRKLIAGLIDGLYADKTRFLIELVANALDEPAGVNPKVQMPGDTNPEFFVRDYGRGMSHDFMMTHYCEVGWSSKDGVSEDASDDADNTIGGFGIGRLSALAVCQMYTVETFIDGVKRVYRVYRGSDRVPELQYIGEAPTDEPNGTLVRVPIPPTDVETTRAAGRKLLRYFQGLNFVGNFKPKEVVTLLESKDSDWKSIRAENYDIETRVIMNGYPYPVDSSKIYDRFSNKEGLSPDQKDALDAIFRTGCFLIPLPVGSVDVTMSREGLEYTKRTKKALIAKAVEIYREIPKLFEHLIADAKNLWDATKIINRARDSIPHNMYRVVRGQLHYEGEPLAVSGFSLPEGHRYRGEIKVDDFSDRRGQYSSTYKPSSLRFKAWREVTATRNGLDPHDRVRFYKVPAGTKYARERILNDAPGGALVILLPDDFNDWSLFGDYDGEVIDASTLPEPYRPPRGTNNTPKNPVKVKVYDWRNKEFNATEAVVAPGSIYVELLDSVVQGFPDFHGIMGCLLKHLGSDAPTIYGFNKTLRGVDRKTMTPALDWVSNEVRNLAAKHPQWRTELEFLDLMQSKVLVGRNRWDSDYETNPLAKLPILELKSSWDDLRDSAKLPEKTAKLFRDYTEYRSKHDLYILFTRAEKEGLLPKKTSRRTLYTLGQIEKILTAVPKDVYLVARHMNQRFIDDEVKDFLKRALACLVK